METTNLPEQPTEVVEQPITETTPAAEATVTETPVAEPTPQPEPQPIQAPVVPVEPDYTPAAVAAKFKDEDLKVLLKEKGYSDFLIEALEYGHRTGGDLAAYWEAKHINWLDKNQVSDEKVLEDKLRGQYAKYQFTKEQTDFLVQRDLKKQYGIGEEWEPDSEEAIEAQLKRQMDAFEYRQQKAQQQASFKAPEPPQPEPQIAPEVVMEQARQGLLADPSVQGFLQAKAVKFGDYTHSIENPESVLQVLYNADAYNNLNYLRDGQGNVVLNNGQPVLDTQRLIKLATYASNMDAVEQKLIEYGKVLGKKSVEDEAEVVPRQTEGSPSLPGERTVLDALAEKLRGR